MKTIIEPFRIRTVEPIQMTTREYREETLKQADYNMFTIRAKDVLIDLLTDSGTGAMSTKQWAALMMGDEAYAGSSSYFELEEVVQELTGFKHVIPVHQGRAAERILFGIMGAEGKVIPNNSHFDTTRANIEFTGTEAVDLPADGALEPEREILFKGNMNLVALRELLEKTPRERIPIGLLTVTNNSLGGQPVSMANIKATARALSRVRHPLLPRLGALRRERVLHQDPRRGLRGQGSAQGDRSRDVQPSPTAAGSRPRRTASSTSAACSR